ncbi:MAG: flagellar hook-length control protein FliK [Acidithiobacillus sp.]
MGVNEVPGQSVRIPGTSPVTASGPPADQLGQGLAPGTKVLAVVLGQNQSGQTLVQIARNQVAMDLPGRWVAGDRVSLLFLGAQSRPTFLYLNPAPLPPDRVALSPTAQSLVEIRQAGKGPAGPDSAATAPVAARMPLPTAQLARALEGALRGSGLFYESHLAAWAQGRMPLATLLAEPQGALSNPHTTANPAQGPAQIREPAAAAMPSTLPENQTPAGQSTGTGASNGTTPDPVLPQAISHAAVQGATVYSQMADLGANPVPSPAQSVHGALANLVGQQLQALMQQQVEWNGTLWPGQWAHWQVEKRKADGGQGGPTEVAQHRWVSTMTLQLPQLGEVRARFVLTGNSLAVQVWGTENATLSAGRSALESALAAAGLHVTQCEIFPGFAHD